MNNWRTAYAIDVLRDEVNAYWPHRSTASDGTIGDANHRGETSSQHNPNARGVVTAFDITHDPTGGPDGDELAAWLVARGKAGDRRIWYVVWDRHIYSSTYGFAQRHYDGVDPHTNHVHLSMSQDRANYDSTRPWHLEDGMALSDADVNRIAKAVWALAFDNRGLPAVDGQYPQTTPKAIMERDHARVVAIEAAVVK